MTKEEKEKDGSFFGFQSHRGEMNKSLYLRTKTAKILFTKRKTICHDWIQIPDCFVLYIHGIFMALYCKSDLGMKRDQALCFCPIHNTVFELVGCQQQINTMC